MATDPPSPAQDGDTTTDRVSAIKSRACPKCGGKAEWEPRRKALVCPYCGKILQSNEAEDEIEIIEEHDLRQTLRSVEEASKGLEKGQRKVHCQQCNADALVSSSRVADRCQFCGSPSIVAYEEIDSAIKPESLLPKSIDQSRAHGILKEWVGKRFWAPRDLKRLNVVDQLKGIYLPYWTFDASTRCPWTAESGDYYWVTERYTDSQGKRKSRRVRKTRWYPSSGEIRHQFDDVQVTASTVVPPRFLRAIGPFPTKDLVPYDTAYVAGWPVEHYSISLFDAAKTSRTEMQATLRNLCAKTTPGATYRHLRIFPKYSNETFKHILVPVWLTIYQYRRKKYQTVINGYTGQITGDYPKSWIKITLTILLILVVAAIIVLLVRS